MKRTRAQSIAEYSICVVGIILAVIMMQTFVRRGLQGRYHDLVEHTASRVTSSGNFQYEPYYRNENFSTDQTENIEEKALAGGGKSVLLEDATKRQGTSIEEINPYVEE